MKKVLFFSIVSLLLYCLTPKSAHAAGAPPLQVCNDAGVESGADGCNLPVNATSGNIIVITFNLSDTTQTVTANSTCVTSFTATPHSPVRGSTSSVWIFYGVTTGGCRGMNVSITGASSFGAIVAMEYEDFSGVLDCDGVGGTGTGTSWSAPGCATANAIDTVVAVAGTDQSGTTCNTGIGSYTTVFTHGGTGHGEQVMDLNTASTGTYSAGCTAAISSSYAMLTAAFEQTGSTPTADAPGISPSTGAEASPTTVTMSCTDPSPTIYYTTDGTTPTSGSTVYSSPFSQTTPATVEAYCTAAGYLDSSVTIVYYFAGTPTAAELPRLSVDLTIPTQTGTVYNVASGDATDFQNKINGATCGDTIKLVAGSTYTGNFTIPSTSCSGWIIVESSALASLPASGTRIDPSDVSNMPVIATNNTGPALAFLPGSNHWRFIGTEVTRSGTTDVFWLIVLGLESDNSTNVSTLSDLPNQIIFDRTYILGDPTLAQEQRAGINANTQAFALVDSYCDQIINQGFDSQCLEAYNASGPFLIQNNFLQAAGENIMFGGADPAINGLIPSDITIIGNLIQKDVANWRGVVADVKNLFEIKNAQRVLVDGNVMQYDWEAAQHQAIIIRSVNQGGGCSWCSALDVTLSHNLIAHVPMAIVLAPSYDGTSIGTGRVTIKNNIMTDVGNGWGGSWFGYQNSAAATGTPLMHDIIIDHNDMFQDQTFFDIEGIPPSTIINVQLTNNIQDFGSTGIRGQGVTSGQVALDTFAAGYVYDKMVWPTTDPTGYPAGSLWATNLAGIGFTSISGSDPDISGDLTLTSGSAYHNAATDGKDIGVWDWTCYNLTTAAALAGTYNSSTMGSCYPATPGTQVPAAPSNVMILFAAKK